MKVLIVDDNVISLKLLRAVLEQDKCEVVEAGDGVEALALLERQPVQAIVSDVLMPNMDGYRFCHEVRRHPRFFRLPFIVYTGNYNSQNDEAIARAVGVDKFLTKELPAREVVKVLHEVMEQGVSRHRIEVERTREELSLIKTHNESLVQKLKAKNQEVVAAEAKFRALVEQSIAGIYIIQDEKFVYVNPRMAEILGRPAEEIVPRDVFDFVLPEDSAMTRENIRQRMAGELLESNCSFRLMHKNGRAREVEAHGVLSEYEGRPALLGSMLDVTERKQFEVRMFAFADLGKKLGAAKTAKDVGETIIALADQLFGWDCCSLNLYSPEKNRIKSILSWDLIDGQRVEIPSDDDDTEPSRRAQRTIAEGAQLILRKGELTFSASEEGRPYGDTARPSASIMYVPIRDGERVVGIFSIQSYKENAYTQADLDAFQAFADHSGGALNRIQAEEAQVRMAERNAIWSKLGQKLNAAKTAIEAGNIIIEVADQVLGWDCCSVDLYSPEKDRLFTVINKDLINGQRADCAPTYEDREPSAMARRVIEEGALLILREEPLAFSPGVIAFGDTSRPSASILNVPIRDGAKIVGTLSIQSYQMQAYDQEDLGTFQALADHCGGALNRIAAQEAEVRQAEHTAAFSDLGQKLGSAKSPSEAGEIIMAAADRLFGWDACSLNLYSEEKQEVFPVLAMDIVDGRRTKTIGDLTWYGPGPLMRKTIQEGAQLVLREGIEKVSEKYDLFGNTAKLSVSIMFVPVRDGARVMALLSIQSYTPQAYNQSDLKALQALADHCGGTLNRLSAEQASARMAERNAILSKLGQRLNAAKTAVEAGDIIIDVADQVFGWDSCSLDLYMPGTQQVYSVLNKDIINGKRTDCPPGYLNGQPSPRIKRTAEQGAELTLREAPLVYPSDAVPSGDKSRPSASLLSVPIRDGARVVGVISIQSYQFKAYNREDLDTFQALADHCGGALNRIQAEEASQSLQKQLRQAQKMEAIGQLAGGVAHDFNNLLTIMGGNVEMLLWEEKSLSADGKGYLNDIAAAAGRAAALTRQLLTFSRQQAMHVHPLDLNETIGGLTKMLQRILGEHVQIQANFAPNLPRINGDTGMIEQVVMNLVINARDAMPKGGTLTLTTKMETVDQAHTERQAGAREGRFVTLLVQDSGSGIKPEILPRIFEPFFTTKDVGKGTGLGLATVYGIIEQHKGWVEVRSELGQGTAFQIFFPGSEEPKKVETETVTAPLHPGHETVLLVEDEPSVRDICQRALEFYGYTIFSAESGQSALKVWEEHHKKIDLLLTDMVMPGGMNGLELAEAVRQRKPDLKIIIMSGYSAQLVSTDMVAKSITFLQKPFLPKLVAEVVRNCLDGK